MISALRRHLLDRMVLRPSRHAVEYAPKERALATTDTATHEYFIERVYPSDPVDHQTHDPALLILKFPGTAGRAERASDWPSAHLNDVDLKLCTWNAPGYGGSSGRASLRNIADRVEEYWHHVTAGVDTSRTRIWLVGNSLGCVTACFLASRVGARVNGLVLRNPPLLVETVKRVARKYPLGHLTDPIAESLPDEMNLSVTASRVDAPTVLLQSECDGLVPPELQMQVFRALPDPKRLVVLHGLDHDDIATEEHERDIAHSIRWLWDVSSQTADDGGAVAELI